MKKEQNLDLVAGRLSRPAASRGTSGPRKSSAYDSNRLGITPEQEGDAQSELQAAPQADPKEAAVAARRNLVQWPPPEVKPTLPLAAPVACSEQAQFSEVPIATTAPIATRVSRQVPSVPRAQALGLILRRTVVLAPALGGLAVILLVWGLWSWLGGKPSSPQNASASSPRIVAPRQLAGEPAQGAGNADKGSRDAAPDRPAIVPWVPDSSAAQDSTWQSSPLTTDNVIMPRHSSAPESPWPNDSSAVDSVADSHSGPSAAPHVAASAPATPPARPIRYRSCPSGIRLTAIAERYGRPIATINGRFLRVGDEIDGAKIIQINARTVDMELQGERFELRFAPVVQAPVAEPDKTEESSGKEPASQPADTDK